MTVKRICFAALTLIACLPALSFAGQEESMPPMGPSNEIKEIAKKVVGTWDVAMKVKMDPAADWAESKCTAVFSTILDGCAVQMDFQGTMGGMPFHGLSTTTYDRETKQWVESWIDSMGARMSFSRGTYTGDTLVMNGEDIMMGQKHLTRGTTTWKGADAFEWKAEMSMDNGKTWNAWGMGSYTRKK